MREIAEYLRQQGLGGDTILAHINPEEADYLAENEGYDYNPTTGLPQFGLFSKVKKGVKKIGKGIKKGFKKVVEPVVRTVGDVAQKAAPFASFIPGIGPVFSTALGAGGSLLSGDSLSKALQSGLMGGLGGLGIGALGGSGALGGLLGGMTGAVPAGGWGAAAGGGASGGFLDKLGGILTGGGGQGVMGQIGSILGGGQIGGGALGAALGGLLGYTSSKDIETKTVSELPEWQQQKIREALGGAQQLFQNQAYSVAPMSSQTLSAINNLTGPNATQGYDQAMQALTGQGGPTGDATAYMQKVLRGDFLNSNPYLDDVINRSMADAQSRAISTFGSGSNFRSGAAARGVGDALAGAASGLRYSNYDDERQRQNEAAGNLSQFGLNSASVLGDLMRGRQAAGETALRAGGVLDQYNQNVVDAPFVALQRYLSSIQGNYGGTETSVQPQNQLLNTAAGALGGYQLGSGLFGGGGTPPAVSAPAPATMFQPTNFGYTPGMFSAPYTNVGGYGW